MPNFLRRNAEMKLWWCLSQNVHAVRNLFLIEDSQARYAGWISVTDTELTYTVMRAWRRGEGEDDNASMTWRRAWRQVGMEYYKLDWRNHVDAEARWQPGFATRFPQTTLCNAHTVSSFCFSVTLSPSHLLIVPHHQNFITNAAFALRYTICITICFYTL